MRKFKIVVVILAALLIAAFFFNRFARSDTPPRVTILWPTNGAVATGSIKVVVDAADDRCISSLTLVVDGNDWLTLTDGPMVFPLPTDYFKNGVHTITARADDNTGMPYLGGNPHSDVVANEGISSPVKVTFWNAVTVEWQPAFGTRLPIRASLAYDDADWAIHIKKEDGTILRNILGVSTNGKIDVVWDIKDEHGNEVPADVVYFVTIEATPRNCSNQVVGLESEANTPATLPMQPRPDPAWCKRSKQPAKVLRSGQCELAGMLTCRHRGCSDAAGTTEILRQAQDDRRGAARPAVAPYQRQVRLNRTG
jgi:hypothetical protein